MEMRTTQYPIEDEPQQKVSGGRHCVRVFGLDMETNRSFILNILYAGLAVEFALLNLKDPWIWWQCTFYRPISIETAIKIMIVFFSMKMVGSESSITVGTFYIYISKMMFDVLSSFLFLFFYGNSVYGGTTVSELSTMIRWFLRLRPLCDPEEAATMSVIQLHLVALVVLIFDCLQLYISVNCWRYYRKREQAHNVEMEVKTRKTNVLAV